MASAVPWIRLPVPPAAERLCDPEALRRDLAAAGDDPLPVLRAALAAGSREIEERFRHGADSDNLVRGRAWLMDQLLVAAWERLLGETAGRRLALVAVGGYGRGELTPASDVDILVLLPDDTAAGTTTAVERFLTLLWDLGLDVGHSVRTLADCVQQAEADITVATNLMEARHLAGDQALFRAMQEATGPARLWTGARFFEAKLEEQERRHHRHQDTGYRLEPNVKESPGGLRDIQTIGWVAKRHFGVARLADLVDKGFLTAAEYDSLARARSFLWRIRFALHSLTGRREDRLLFEYQRALARELGYSGGTGPHAEVEAFMQDYYRTVMEVDRLNEMLLQLFRELIVHGEAPAPPILLNRRFQNRGGYLEIREPDLFRRYPFALLELFLLLAQHPELQGVRAATIRAVRDHRHLIDDRFRNDLRCRSLFMEILRQPRGITHELRRMNRYGILAAYLPAFGAIVGQMQFDLFHVYTVDEHSLFVVRNLRRFTVPEHADEVPFCSRLARQIPKFELLVLAGLFHDIAKGRGGDHSQLGAADAEAFCRHHGLGEFDSHLVAWLVRNHLLMSTTAQRRDISDPEVVNEFARHVVTLDRLNYLYLLTVADIRATNPTLWNSWRDALLRELYHNTAKALRRGLERPLERREHIRQVRKGAYADLASSGHSGEAVRRLWQRFNDDYFLRHSADQIRWHTATILEHWLGGNPGPVVDLRHDRQRGGTDILIYMPSRDRLFEQIAADLDRLGLTIAEARITTTDDDWALDSFLVLDRSGAPVEDPHRIRQIRDRLNRLLATADGGRQPRRHPPHQYRHFQVPVEVHFHTDEAADRTVLELIAADRPGLLAQVADAFRECNIRLQDARISTFGSRAEDVFYITDHHDHALRDGVQQEALRQYLLAMLEQD